MRCSLPTRSAGLLGAVLLTFTAMPSAAQQTDPRWLSWLGCWERAENETFPERRLTCMVPADSGTGVEVVALIGGRVVNSERIEASGSERALDEDGCTGTERTAWSADGARLYRGISVECQGGLRQNISQLFAMMSDGSWLDIQGVALPEGTGLRRLRYRSTTLEGVPDVISSRLSGMDDIKRAQTTAAQSPVTSASVIEASQQLQAPVVQVWLAERHQGFTLNARELRALSSAGVAGEVIDIMVALTYPRAFRLEPNLQVTERLAASQTTGGYIGSTVRYADLASPQPYYCNPWVDSYDLFLSYGSTYCVANSRYINRYGYAGWGGYNWNYRSIILTAGGEPVSGIGNPPAPTPHGRVGKAGYQQDPSVASTGRQAQPREPSHPGGSNTSNTSSNTNTSNEQPASPSTGSTGSSTPASPPPQRTAQPRQP